MTSPFPAVQQQKRAIGCERCDRGFNQATIANVFRRNGGAVCLSSQNVGHDGLGEKDASLQGAQLVSGC
jgi:hypothetical protein